MIIIFREIFISGLREFLGVKSQDLAVTRLAKWKTMVQMVAVVVLFAHLLLEHYFGILSFAMEREFVVGILNGTEEDLFGLKWKYTGYVWSFNIGIILLWLAAALTALTGLDYYRKSLPHLRDEDQQ
jgi:cardiolipin synthase (CMP-forming)